MLTFIGEPLRRIDDVVGVGQQRERELYDEPHQALRVEHELVARSVLVADERVETLHLCEYVLMLNEICICAGVFFFTKIMKSKIVHVGHK